MLVASMGGAKTGANLVHPGVGGICARTMATQNSRVTMNNMVAIDQAKTMWMR